MFDSIMLMEGGGDNIIETGAIEEIKKNSIIYRLPDEKVIDILSYLRSIDLCSCAESSKYLFSGSRISKAIELSLSMYGIPILRKNDDEFLKPELLYIHEMKSIIAAVSAPQSLYGYWISSSWIANAKKYYETLSIPDGKKSSKKQTKIRLRRGSDALPPWPAINTDITCRHGCLALTAGPRAKRKVIEKKHWKILRKFYPCGAEFSLRVPNCPACEELIVSSKSSENLKREIELKARQIESTDPLFAVFARRCGVPSTCLRLTGEEAASLYEATSTSAPPLDEWSCLACTSFNPFAEEICHCCQTVRTVHAEAVLLTRPLRTGIYNIVPRYWLKSWRQYIKDPSVQCLPCFDCTSLLCYAHGLLVVPPHVDEYIRGIRRTLLTNLGEYPGDLFEIVMPEEFDSLNHLASGPIASNTADFAVRFFCDETSIDWNIEVCRNCDPFNYHGKVQPPDRKGRSASLGFLDDV